MLHFTPRIKTKDKHSTLMRLRILSLKYFLLIPLALVIFPLCAQNTKNPRLDEHRHFKEIRLGDNIEKWKKHLTKIDSSSKVQEYLFDIRLCCDKVFSRDVQNIHVLSKNNKIVSIRIQLLDFLREKSMATTSDFKVALSEMVKSHMELVIEFNSQFGEYETQLINEGVLVNTGKEAMTVHQWKGNNTLLTMEMYLIDAVYGSDKDSATGLTKMITPAQEISLIVLSDLNFIKSEKSSGF